MRFADVIGNDELKKRLAQAVQSGRISHAQMLLGREGSGNLAIALALAQFVNCSNKQELDSCGICSSCVKAAKLIHPDIHFTYPTVTTITSPTSADFIKPWREAVLQNPYMNVQDWLAFITEENKQGNITAAECRRILQLFNLKVFEGPYKILILWMPEYLEKEGNVLLKLFEEPAPNSLFLLVANAEDEILSTILSRTQITRVPPVNDEVLSTYIKTRYSLPDANCHDIARLSEGNVREALLLVQHADNPYIDLWAQWLNAAISNNPIEVQRFIDNAVRLGREQVKVFYNYVLMFFRECLMLGVTGECKLLPGERALAEQVNSRLNFEQLEYIVHIYEEGIYHVERNANPKIQFMYISRHMQLLLRGAQPADLGKTVY